MRTKGSPCGRRFADILESEILMSRQNYGFIYGSAGKRYPRYFRCLRELLMNGIMKISSAELAERLGLTPSQVRADLNGFGGAGQQGYGYHVKTLYTEISRELGAGDRMTAVILGGEPSTVSYLAERFEGRGVTAVAHVTSVSGEGSVPKVLPSELTAYLEKETVDLAVVVENVTGEAPLAPLLVSHGIRGIWNMTQQDMEAEIPVLNLPVGDIMMSLCCDVRHAKDEKGGKTS